MRGESGVAGEGRVVGVPKFHSWGKCTMPLTQIECATFPLACVLTYIIYLFTRVLYFASWGVILRWSFKLHLGVTVIDITRVL